MQVRIHSGVSAVDEFVSIAGPLYRRDPVRHTVELTLLRGGPLPGDEAPRFLTLWDGTELAGAAMQTPPFPLLCGGFSPSAVPVVVDALAERAPLSGVRGPRDTALAFAREWQAVTGAAAEAGTGERLYRLGALRPPVGVSGGARIAGPADEATLVDFQCDFAAEAFGHVPDPAKARAAIDAAAAAGDVYLLWSVAGVAVSMAGVRAAAAGVSRIGPVYTPPGSRGRGYGSAVTAAGARWARVAGATDVVLFTDLANPVSNAIYVAIGFEPVGDGVAVLFT
jgi:GNAT superfamily N-acetyltransferase